MHEEPVDDLHCEFPRIHDGYTGRRHRYAWAARVDGRGDEVGFGGVLKYDLHTGCSEAHGWGKGRGGGEAVFVPRRGARDEDDGYLLTFVWDALEQRSELVIVNAKAMVSRPLARVPLPQRVPFGFHGMWLDSERIS